MVTGMRITASRLRTAPKLSSRLGPFSSGGSSFVSRLAIVSTATASRTSPAGVGWGEPSISAMISSMSRWVLVLRAMILSFSWNVRGTWL